MHWKLQRHKNDSNGMTEYVKNRNFCGPTKNHEILLFFSGDTNSILTKNSASTTRLEQLWFNEDFGP